MAPPRLAQRGMKEAASGPAARQGGRFFREPALAACASGVAVGYLWLLFAQLAWNSSGIGADGKNCRDFTWIWLSGRLAQSPLPEQIYDHAAFAASRVALAGPSNCQLGHFDNPPTILFFTYPLGSMPYRLAFVAWLAATLALYLAAVYAILPRPAAILAALAPYPVFINTLLGHNGFLTAGLVGFGLVCIEHRPWLSGIFLALLTYKPQFGILFPLALLASRNWRALVSAAIASLVLALVGAAAFGWQTWPMFFAALADRAARLSRDPSLDFWLISTAGFLRALGVGAAAAWGAQAIVTAVVALTVYVLWRRPIPYALQAAALAAGSVLAAPHAFGYDASILTIAVAFLVRDAIARGFLAGERPILLLCWAALFVLRGPIPAIACAVLLALVVRRVAGASGAPVWQLQGQRL
jgi:hypothetical protein